MDSLSLLLDVKHVDYICNVLGRCPLAEALPVYQSIAAQVQGQQRAAAAMATGEAHMRTNGAADGGVPLPS